MHLELPEVRLHSLKDFSKHYLMIVLSILTALGLEAWIGHAHHRNAAATASRRMEQELHADLDGIGPALSINQRTLAGLRKLDGVVAQDIQAGVSTAQINRYLQDNQRLFLINLNWPGLSTDAWDVAVADQSASWMEPATLQRYSSGYSAVRELTSWIQHDSMVFFSGTNMIDFRTDLRTGQPIDARAFLHELGQAEATIDATQNQLRSLQEQLRKIVGTTPGASVVPAHPTAAD